MHKAIPITMCSWFIQDDIEKSVGIFHKRDNNTYLYLTPSDKISFDNIGDAEVLFQWIDI